MIKFHGNSHVISAIKFALWVGLYCFLWVLMPLACLNVFALWFKSSFIAMVIRLCTKNLVYTNKFYVNCTQNELGSKSQTVCWA
jgi:hypothetical protein